MNPPVISLTTDFGERDGFTGAMKGVILSINPHVRIVDISHHIPPQDLIAGAMVLGNACPYFPLGTIHVAVIDPGVGSTRRAMVAATDYGRFVLPDNGLLTFLERKTPIREAYAIENPDFMLPDISKTFHGRDIFAPVAAHLSCGRSLKQAGSKIEDWVRLDLPLPRRGSNVLEGEVIYVDHFGNLFCNIEADAVAAFGSNSLLKFQGGSLAGLKKTYSEVPHGEPLFLIGSGGFLEIAINGGSAHQQLGLEKGAVVSLSQIRA